MKTALIGLGLLVVIAINLVAFRSHLRKVQIIPVPVDAGNVGSLLIPDLSIVVVGPDSVDFHGSRMSFAEFTIRLTDLKKAGATSVKVTSAQGVSYEAVVSVLDCIRKVGIERVEIGTHSP